MKRSTSLRNKPCPCGSGTKFKRCHGDEARAAKLRQKALEPIKQESLIQELFKDTTGARALDKNDHTLETPQI